MRMKDAAKEGIASFFRSALAARGEVRFRSAKVMRDAWEMQVAVHFV